MEQVMYWAITWAAIAHAAYQLYLLWYNMRWSKAARAASDVRRKADEFMTAYYGYKVWGQADPTDKRKIEVEKICNRISAAAIVERLVPLK